MQELILKLEKKQLKKADLIRKFTEASAVQEETDVVLLS